MYSILIAIALAYIQFPFDHYNACKGYGDYNATAGLHQALDFQAQDLDELAYSPFEGTLNTADSIWAMLGSLPREWVVGLARDQGGTTGWSYQHMYDSMPPQAPDQYLKGTWFDETIGTVVSHSLGAHLHVGWVDTTNWYSQQSKLYQPGYFNPFDSLQTPPGYSDAPILTELHEIPSLVGTGLMVYEDYSLPQTYSDASVLQGVV